MSWAQGATILRMKTIITLWVALAALASAELAQARHEPVREAPGSDRQVCDVAAVTRALAKPLKLTFPNGQDSGGLLDLVCMPHPEHQHLTIVALFHEIRDDKGASLADQTGFVAAVIDAKRGTLKGLYRETLDINPGIRITETSLSIDPARYELASGLRAFGVRMDIGHSPKCADGGSSDFLTLLVPNGPELRPVLKRQPMHVWSVAKWNLAEDIGACAMDTVNEAHLAMAVGPSSHHGWRDLVVTARMRTKVLDDAPGPWRSRNKALTTLQYDGEHYPARLGSLTTKLLKP